MWSDAVPNFLIGLREGLEAGLIVSIVLATIVRSGRPDGRPDGRAWVWAGVVAAALLALAFGAVLTFAAADLSTSAQEAIGGTLSLVAVGFVTWMVFWMRRSAPTLSHELRTRTESALEVGGRLLFGIAFFAVAREGLETALFLWSTTRTASESTGPLLGAVAGLGAAGLLCWALYRRALRIDLSRFFAWTGGALIVVAAGVAAYGIRELQGAGILPGVSTSAFDLSAGIDPSAWYARLVEGVFNLTTQMTVLQVAGYVLYLVAALGLFVYLALRVEEGAHEARPAVVPVEVGVPAPAPPSGPRRPVWLLVGAVGVIGVLITFVVIAALGPKPSGDAAAIVVSDEACAAGWSAPPSGRRSFEIRNTSSQQIEIYLMDADRRRAHGEIEALAPGTARTLAVSLAPGSYVWQCVTPDGQEAFSTTQQATGAAAVGVRSYVPVTAAELDDSTQAYRALVEPMLATLAADTDALLAAVTKGGATDESKALWLRAHLDYLRLGAAYGTFGDLDAKINGRPNGLPDGVADPGFTGFLRLERELWQAPSGADPQATAAQLAADVHELVAAFPDEETDPADLPLRSHEILENGLQLELTGDTDHGSRTNLASLRADVDATRIVLGTLTGPLSTRNPELYAAVTRSLDDLAATLDQYHQPDGGWTPLTALTLAQRQTVNGQVSQLVEDLAPIPEILELSRERELRTPRCPTSLDVDSSPVPPSVARPSVSAPSSPVPRRSAAPRRPPPAPGRLPRPPLPSTAPTRPASSSPPRPCRSWPSSTSSPQTPMPFGTCSARSPTRPGS